MAVHHLSAAGDEALAHAITEALEALASGAAAPHEQPQAHEHPGRTER